MQRQLISDIDLRESEILKLLPTALNFYLTSGLGETIARRWATQFGFHRSELGIVEIYNETLKSLNIPNDREGASGDGYDGQRAITWHAVTFVNMFTGGEVEEITAALVVAAESVADASRGGGEAKLLGKRTRHLIRNLREETASLR